MFTSSIVHLLPINFKCYDKDFFDFYNYIYSSCNLQYDGGAYELYFIVLFNKLSIFVFYFSFLNCFGTYGILDY